MLKKLKMKYPKVHSEMKDRSMWKECLILLPFTTEQHMTSWRLTCKEASRSKALGRDSISPKRNKHARNIAVRNRRIEEERLRVMGDEKELPVFVYIYEFDPQKMKKLNVKRFDNADREWLRFIIVNRMNRTRQHEYDIVIGPTANDDTRTSIRTVMNAANGAVLSDVALNLLIEMLKPEKLPEQYYFGTSKAVAMLKLMGRREMK
jgi:hypothetical protein